MVSGVIAQDTIRSKNYLGNLKKTDISIGGQPCTFLFDTGGGETLISPDIAKILNKFIYGHSTGYRMNGDRLTCRKCDSVCISLGVASIFHPTVGVWDIMSILPEGFTNIDGVISLKSFKDKIVTLDLAND